MLRRHTGGTTRTSPSACSARSSSGAAAWRTPTSCVSESSSRRLTATTLSEEAPAARGYFVEPYSDGLRAEAHVEVPETTAAMGQLWSTTGDLARWGSFLAAGHEPVLARETLDEMALVQTMVDTQRWTVAWGLGLQLVRRGERVLAGHGGAMPGFLAALFVERVAGIGAVVLTNSSAGPDPEALALDLATEALDALPERAQPWRPDGGAPAGLEPLLGRWWTEGRELVFSVRAGRLKAVRWADRRAATRPGSRRTATIGSAWRRAGSWGSSSASCATSTGRPCGCTSRPTRSRESP